jgi:hypothetical protein
MRKFVVSLIVAAVMTSSAALAVAAIVPHSGRFKQVLHNKVPGGTAATTISITVAGGQIKSARMVGTVLPYSSKLSKGYACQNVNDDNTADPAGAYVRTGKVDASGHFDVTFVSKKIDDRVTVVGHFTDAKHAVATFRDVYVVKIAKSHCDTGNLSVRLAR